MNPRGYKRPCRSYEHTHGHVSALHVFIYLLHAHRLPHVCIHNTHKHTHTTHMNSEHTSMSHVWTHTTHTHIPHTVHTNVFITYAVPHHTSHMYTHNTRIHPCTHTCHMHIPWQNAQIPHMYHIHTNYAHRYFPFQHSCMDTHTHTHTHTRIYIWRERMNMSGNPGAIYLRIGGYMCPCMYVRVRNVCVSQWFVCIW